MKQISKLKKELLAAIVSLMIAAVCLTSATYAWYVANNTVTATTATISARTNGFILQIATLADGIQNGGNDKTLEAVNVGSVLSPASTNNLQDWYVCGGWNERGMVTNYSKPTFKDPATGYYKSGGKDYHAFYKSSYILYTIRGTGEADVYLEGSSTEAPVTISTSGGNGEDTVVNSLRVAITTQPLDSGGHSGTGDENLRVVYAFNNEADRKGNDSSDLKGWTYVKDESTLDNVSYPYLYGTKYQDQHKKNWVATKDGDNFTVPEDSQPIAQQVDENGIVVHVYIWMEGTDSDCINGQAVEEDTTKYDITVKFAGVAASS